MKRYNSTDIQDILEHINSDPKYKEEFLRKVKTYCTRRDYDAILHVINENWVETFDQYDSDVCETFLLIYEDMES